MEPSDSRRLPKVAESRRVLAESSEDIQSARSSSLEAAIKRNLVLEDRLAAEASESNPSENLRRLLSLKSIISTTSSFAERQQAAVGNPNVVFREIGTGSIAKVFEHPGTTFVYKLPLLDRSDKIWNNFVMHQRIQYSFQTLPYKENQVEIPTSFWYANENTKAFWEDNIDRFPNESNFPRKPREALCMERIFPLPEPIRNSLIELFCLDTFKEQARQEAKNKDCLVRPILGRVRYGRGDRFFSLRNFKLHFDQFEQLDMQSSATELANSMGHALAVLHWHTKVDGNDIEFVLGSSPQDEQRVRVGLPLDKILSLEKGSSTFEWVTHSKANFHKRLVSLWLVDFDACSDITMDEAGVDKAVTAFLDTDPYCPRPNGQSVNQNNLWLIFASAYTETADKILTIFLPNPGAVDLPKSFIKKVSDRLATRQSPLTQSSVPGPTGVQDLRLRPRAQLGSSDGRNQRAGTTSRGSSSPVGSWRGGPTSRFQGPQVDPEANPVLGGRGGQPRGRGGRASGRYVGQGSQRRGERGRHSGHRGGRVSGGDSPNSGNRGSRSG